MDDQGFSKIWILFILIILVGGGILMWQYFGKRGLTEVEYSIKKEDKIESVSTIPGWKTYQNLQYGYKIQYPKDFKESSDKTEVTFSLPLEAASVSILVSQQPAVLFSGTYGGWYSFEEDSEQPDRVFSHEIVLNNITFKREYWAAYGGMGGWDNVINCYTKYKDKYYIISLEHVFAGGVPGTIIAEGRKLTKEEIIKKALEKMLDEKNEYVRVFNQMLSTFKFSE